MAKKTKDPRKGKKIHQTNEEIEKLLFSLGGTDRPLRITLSDGRAIDGRVTGGGVDRHLQEVDADAAKMASDLLSGEVELTDSAGNTHSIDLLDVESVILPPLIKAR